MASGEERNDLSDWTAGIAERKIQEAVEEGLFDNLPGQGKPLDLSVNPFEPPGMGAVNRLLRHNKVLPLWVMLEQEIEAARMLALATLAQWEVAEPGLRDRPEYGRLRDAARSAYEKQMRHTNDLILKYNCSSPFALRSPVTLMVTKRLREFDARYGISGDIAP